jgi:hypothetical protein
VACSETCCESGTAGGGINKMSLYRETMVEKLSFFGKSWDRRVWELPSDCRPVILSRVLQSCKRRRSKKKNVFRQ